MPTNQEPLEALRDGFENLHFQDEDTLGDLRESGRARIRRAFAEDSDYYQRFIRIAFHVPFAPATEETSRECWDRGKRSIVSLLNGMLEDLELSEPNQVQSAKDTVAQESNRVFVVHGHDKEMKQAVARTVERLGLEAVILHEKPSRGQTIIEKIERYSDVGFAVVLLSPDDTGYLNSEGTDSAKPRARQNVIMELGYFAGKLGREKVVALHRGGVELPSDYDGVLYTPYDSDSGTWRSELVAELRESGYEVSADNL
jgi:predicted nucleotide-binding protein